ncbi:FGGY-family carbohydrate kinase [Celeribacter baekdonensis]|uniref:FGGY-family carbohydrate kinase n=1 Tax=Celeribacter baekdonensis TaxID=875171 RepID=UPI0030D74A6B|tara:strand:- start:72097 stop:73473 length:1377 start_codon:yes stop_codon:yes gene_type:complete
MSAPETIPRHIAVTDVGKTNAKLALVDGQSLREIAVVTRPNTVLMDAPYPHFDLEGHWAFFLEHLRAFHASHGIDAISVTTHGASVVLLDAQGALATPMLDYEHTGPDDTATRYDAIRPPFAETGSPRLPMGLNVGAQLYWLFDQDPELQSRTAHILTYPQYWGYLMTGNMATDISSLGCHTDLWDPEAGRFSTLVERLGLTDKIAPAHRSSDILGAITPEIAALTGLDPRTPVVCGIHDSNASLLPHLIGREGAFSVISTGTWVIAMSVNGASVTLDPTRDTLINANAYGQPVPSARFMGGREFDMIRDGSNLVPTPDDRARVLRDGVMLLPAVVPQSGPFAGRRHSWTQTPKTDGERIFALSLYLALMTHTCLDLIGAAGPCVVEGPFGANADYLAMLDVLRGEGVEIATSSTGTSVGAALLFAKEGAGVATVTRAQPPAPNLIAYARHWQDCVGI